MRRAPATMNEGYLIPSGSVRSELIVNKSRFITDVRRAPTAADARKVIAEIRSAMPKANHHVYAFLAGFGNSVTEGMSDAGEPSGTAGPPTLAVLRGAKIGDIVLVTSRYFGGIKLGKGGLVRAYSEAARRALSQVRTELKVEWRAVGLDLPYSLYQVVKQTIGEFGGVVEEEDFGAAILIIARFVAADIPAFTDELHERTAGTVTPVPLS